MCRPTTPKVNFYLRKYAKKEEGWIYISFYIQRKKINFSTKISCKENDWNEEKCYVKKTDKEHSDKNLLLNNISSKINDVFVKYRLKNKQITREGFLKSYNRTNELTDFHAYCKEKKKLYSRLNEDTTMQTHVTVLKKLKEFKSEIEFDDLTDDFLALFYAYLRKKLKNNDNTAYKNMAILRKYVRKAYKEGHIDENPFDDFKIPRTKANYTFLTDKELNQLITFYKKGNLELRHHKTLQFFLFMCFSSQHVSDARKMKLEQFSDTTFTYFRVKLRNRKPEPIIVPISSTLRWIVNEIVGRRKVGGIFENLPADQTMNNHLKEIAKLVGIEKNITHKTARHTFATIFLSNTNDLNSLKNILGHSDIRETLIYAHVLEKNKVEGVKCFDKFI